MKRTLIVVDMLNDFLKEDGVLYCGDEARKIIPNVLKKIKEYEGNGDQIIYLMDSHRPDDKEFEKFPLHCVEGSVGAELIKEIKEITTLNSFLYIPKRRYSGFFNTNLDVLLKLHMPDLVEVVGVCTSICVMDTVGGLANRDYKVKVCANCVADFNPEMHRMSLDRMKNIYGAEIEWR